MKNLKCPLCNDIIKPISTNHYFCKNKKCSENNTVDGTTTSFYYCYGDFGSLYRIFTTYNDEFYYLQVTDEKHIYLQNISNINIINFEFNLPLKSYNSKIIEKFLKLQLLK